MSSTTNLGLTLTPESDTTTTFKNWRVAMNGEGTSSNMSKIDKAVGDVKRIAQAAAEAAGVAGVADLSVTPDKTLANNTPATIQAVAKAGVGANYWSVGDKIGITLSGTVGALSLSGTHYAFIIGFNHNSTIEGGNNIHFQLGKTSGGIDTAFVDNGYSSYYSNNTSARFVMNTTNINSGGWDRSYMRKTICPAFYNTLPSAWRSVIVPCTKYTDNTGNASGSVSTNVTTTSDNIWLK